MVMLTNLVEFEQGVSRVKCAKYWPDQINDVQIFGEFTVTLSHEQQYTDYVVRELKVMANYDVGSRVRHITQFHYLAWSDLMAPGMGVIEFLHQINKVYSPERGPILVHCSGTFRLYFVEGK